VGARATAECAAAGAPDEALLRSAQTLRRLGARLTRYDAEEATLEARAWPWRVEVTIRVSATAQGQGTRLRIESETGNSRRLVAAGVNAWTVRRVRAALARAT
jgi:hypothetical protein